MDYVNRYEDRTLWGQGAELRTKFVRTQVDLRARPPGESSLSSHHPNIAHFIQRADRS